MSDVCDREQATIEGSGSAPESEVGADGLIAPELVAELATSAKLVALVHKARESPTPRLNRDMCPHRRSRILCGAGI